MLSEAAAFVLLIIDNTVFLQIHKYRGHDMTEVENLSDRIAILSGGKIAFIGTVEQRKYAAHDCKE